DGRGVAGIGTPALRIRLGEGIRELVPGLAEAELVDGRPLAGRLRLTRELPAHLLARRAELGRRAGATLAGAAVGQRRDEGADRGVDERVEAPGVGHGGTALGLGGIERARELLVGLREARGVDANSFLEGLGVARELPAQLLGDRRQLLDGAFLLG